MRRRLTANDLPKDITANGPEDPVYQTYFGKGSYVEAIGAYEALLHSNKAGVLLRCDDIDGKWVLSVCKMLTPR
jgi:hypothetical protein